MMRINIPKRVCATEPAPARALGLSRVTRLWATEHGPARWSAVERNGFRPRRSSLLGRPPSYKSRMSDAEMPPSLRHTSRAFAEAGGRRPPSARGDPGGGGLRAELGGSEVLRTRRRRSFLLVVPLRWPRSLCRGPREELPPAWSPPGSAVPGGSSTAGAAARRGSSRGSSRCCSSEGCSAGSRTRGRRSHVSSKSSASSRST